MAAKKMPPDVSGKSGQSVHGSPKMNDVAVEEMEKIDGSLEWVDGGGMQHGQHPAKSQPKIMRFFG